MRILLIFGLLLGSSLVEAAWFEDSQAVMGTRVHAELWADDGAVARRVLGAIIGEMQRVEHAYSPYLAESELSLLNQRAASGWVQVSAELFDLSQFCLFQRSWIFSHSPA